MSSFRDKVAFVTGAGSGLGRSISEELARSSAICVVTDVNGDAAARVAENIKAAGGRACSMQLDVTQPARFQECIRETTALYGRIDYLFNNAGIIILGEIRDMDLHQWNRILGVNVFGVVNGTMAAYEQMVRQGSGHIVNVASVGGLVQLPTYAAYAATKHAVVGLSTSMRPEAAKLGVNVSVVCPGPMETGMGAAATILRADRRLLESRSRKAKRDVDPGVAARLVLRGVERNRRVIIFPFSARVLWWLHRIQPAWLAPLDSWFVNHLRAARTEAGEAACGT